MLYLKLFHGRKDPNQDMEDWGFDGPVFGPIQYAHVVYHHHVAMQGYATGGPPVWEGWLEWVGDLLYYDGAYYGDWSVFEPLDESDPMYERVFFVPDKARLPKQGKRGGRCCA